MQPCVVLQWTEWADSSTNTDSLYLFLSSTVSLSMIAVLYFHKEIQHLLHLHLFSVFMADNFQKH